MRNAANDLFDWVTLILWVVFFGVMILSSNNDEFSNYLHEVIYAIYDYFL